MPSTRAKTLRPLTGAALLLLLGVLPGLRLPAAAPEVTFTHGVASGDVTASSAVLWTRAGGPGPLTVELSTDPEFRQVVLRRIVVATRDNDFTAKAVVSPLAPARTYFYRWRSAYRGRRGTSETGTFKTPPSPSAETGVLRFAFSGDTSAGKAGGVPFFNRFEAMDAIRRDGAAFFVYLGDVIYSDYRPGGQPDAQTVDEYRALYKENRELPALRALLQAMPIYAIWDDHEVRNDYDGETVDPALYANGREAFLEYMPISERDLPREREGAGAPLFRVFHWGKDVDLFILDERSCRSRPAAEACRNDLAPTLPGALRSQLASLLPAPVPPGCREALSDSRRTMLGSRQKARFKAALLNSQARFKFVINEVPIQALYVRPYDRWEGYAAERREILEFIRDRKIRNVIFLTTDVHMNLINEVCLDRFTDPAPIAEEFVTGPLANYTAEKLVMNTYGPTAGPPALAAWQTLLTVLGVDGRHLDAYSYGLVEVDSRAGTVTVTLKDAGGNVLRDQLKPEIRLTKTIRDAS